MHLPLLPQGEQSVRPAALDAMKDIGGMASRTRKPRTNYRHEWGIIRAFVKAYAITLRMSSDRDAERAQQLIFKNGVKTEASTRVEPARVAILFSCSFEILKL